MATPQSSRCCATSVKRGVGQEAEIVAARDRLRAGEPGDLVHVDRAEVQHHRAELHARPANAVGRGEVVPRHAEDPRVPCRRYLDVAHVEDQMVQGLDQHHSSSSLAGASRRRPTLIERSGGRRLADMRDNAFCHPIQACGDASRTTGAAAVAGKEGHYLAWPLLHLNVALGRKRMNHRSERKCAIFCPGWGSASSA